MTDEAPRAHIAGDYTLGRQRCRRCLRFIVNNRVGNSHRSPFASGAYVEVSLGTLRQVKEPNFELCDRAL